MGTYVFVEKDGNAQITLSAENINEAWTILRDITQLPFRIDYDLSEE